MAHKIGRNINKTILNCKSKAVIAQKESNKEIQCKGPGGENSAVGHYCERRCRSKTRSQTAQTWALSLGNIKRQRKESAERRT